MPPRRSATLRQRRNAVAGPEIVNQEGGSALAPRSAHHKQGMSVGVGNDQGNGLWTIRAARVGNLKARAWKSLLSLECRWRRVQCWCATAVEAAQLLAASRSHLHPLGDVNQASSRGCRITMIRWNNLACKSSTRGPVSFEYLTFNNISCSSHCGRKIKRAEAGSRQIPRTAPPDLHT